MEAATALEGSKIPGGRNASCLWCHRQATYAEVVRNRGLCQPCAEDNEAIGWRVVYDRDRQIGAIPRNLRIAYGL